jgi:Synergist-CTERM protein sorting domain-containing protein
VAAAGCVDGAPELSETDQAATVGDYQSGGCSTAVVIGLSKQIAQEAGCANPNSFVKFDAVGGISFTSNAVLPYLVKGARDDLKLVAASAPVQINSALRTIAQQYLLYRWYQNGQCGITAAATVGHSNHEGGRAVDLANWSSRVGSMSARGWAHDVPGDSVHFDHTSSPDDRGQDTKAFQNLWNRNHPNDKIATDGAYGPQTEARLKQSPATGFAIGPSCGGFALDLDVVSIDGPDVAAPQTRVHYAITLVNSGQADWPASTKLQLASGATSQIYDASWISQNVVTTIGTAVAVGAQTKIEFDVTTPAATVETPISQVFALDDGGKTFGSINFAVTVVPDMTQPTSGDGSEPTPDQMGGGCNAGGGSASLLALAIPMLVLRRRRAALR